MKKYSSNAILRNAKVFEQLATSTLQKFAQNLNFKFKKVAATEAEQIQDLINKKYKFYDVNVLKRWDKSKLSDVDKKAIERAIQEKEAFGGSDATEKMPVGSRAKDIFRAWSAYAPGQQLDYLKRVSLPTLRNARSFGLGSTSDAFIAQVDKAISELVKEKEEAAAGTPSQSEIDTGIASWTGDFDADSAEAASARRRQEARKGKPAVGGGVVGGSAPSTGTGAGAGASKPAGKPSAPTGAVYTKNEEADKLVAESKQYLKTLVETFKQGYPTDRQTIDMQYNITAMYNEIDSMNPLSYNDIGNGLSTVAAYVGGLANLLVAQGTQFQNTIVSLSAYTTYFNRVGLELNRIAQSQPAPAQPAAGKPSATPKTVKGYPYIDPVNQKRLNTYFSFLKDQKGYKPTFQYPLSVDSSKGPETQKAMQQAKKYIQQATGEAVTTDEQLFEQLEKAYPLVK